MPRVLASLRHLTRYTHFLGAIFGGGTKAHGLYLRQLVLLRSAPSTDKKISNSYLAHGAARRLKVAGLVLT